MAKDENKSQKIILDLKKLNELNSNGYEGRFCLGDTVVLACGPWEGGPRWIHERDAIFDQKTKSYIEKGCLSSRKTV